MEIARTSKGQAAPIIEAAIFTSKFPSVAACGLQLQEGCGGVKFQQSVANEAPFFGLFLLPITYSSHPYTPPPVVDLANSGSQSVVGPSSHTVDALNISAAFPSNQYGFLFVEGGSLEVLKMAMCRRCASNGVHREGGQFGVCKYHARTKCQVCGDASLGEQLCASHAHAAELMRWKAQSQFRMQNDAIKVADDVELRKARLNEAKFLAHQALEVAFHSLLGAVVAVWAHPSQWEKLDEKKEKVLESA